MRCLMDGWCCAPRRVSYTHTTPRQMLSCVWARFPPKLCGWMAVRSGCTTRPMDPCSRFRGTVCGATAWRKRCSGPLPWRTASWSCSLDPVSGVPSGYSAARRTVPHPGVVTAWGRRAVLTSSDGRGLIVLTAAPIEQAGEVSMGGRVLGLAASPSTHEIYVAVDDPPRLEAVNRFALSTRVLADLPSPATDMRSSLFGDAIFVAYGSDIGRVPAGGGAVSPVASVWRADLPVGLPDGTVLTGSEEGIGLSDPVSGTASLIDGAGPDRWWLPVRWNPTSPTIATDRVSGELVRPDPEEVARPGAGVDSTLVVQRPTAAPRRRDESAAERDAPGPPPGFYAIVGSARQSEGIRSLTASLEDAGFSARQSEGIRSLTASLEDAGFLTQVHRFRDEAGRTWYRGLVGPFRSRSEAEAASRQLLRERRLEAWVTEIGASGRPEEEPI